MNIRLTIVENDFKHDFFKSIGSELQELQKMDDAPLVMHKLTNQITYVVKGEGIAVLGDEIRTISEGHILAIPRKMQHCFKCVGQLLILQHYHWPQDYLETDRVILQEDFDIRKG